MASRLADIDWILWSGTVGLERPIPERVEAAVAFDFTSVSVSPLDIHRAEQGGTPAKRDRSDDPRSRVADHRRPGHELAPRDIGVAICIVLGRAVFALDRGLEAVSLTAVAMDETDVPVEAIGEPFAGLCDRAADVGAQVHLEFMPISCVATLREAWTIVDYADRANGGIVFDTWHFFRGDPDFDLLATVPGDRIYCVQIDDAAAIPRTSLRDDTKNRPPPGDGDLTSPVRSVRSPRSMRCAGSGQR